VPPAIHDLRQGVAAEATSYLNGALLMAAVAAVGTAGWLYAGEVSVLPAQPTPEYVLFLPGLPSLAISLALAAGAVAAARYLLFRASAPLWPLLLLAFPGVTLLLLATRARTYAPAWMFLFYDWRWWFVGVVGTLVVGEWLAIRQRAGHQSLVPRGVLGNRRRAEAIVVALLATLTVVTSPRDRFKSLTDGDEPKYLRFDENWYRGRGMNVALMEDIKELPPGATPDVLRNVPRLVHASVQVVQDLGQDLCHVVSGCPAPPRAAQGSNQFIVGKRGGLYQIHTPGAPLVFLPAYYLDRLLNTTNLYHPHFPTYLYATNILLIGLYLAWAAVLYRVLAEYSGDTTLSAIVVVVVMSSLPAVAFTYQYYPEVLAGLMVTLLFKYLVMSADARSSIAFVYGVMAGYMPWLHLRFGPIAVVAAGLYWVTRAGQRRAISTFFLGTAIPLTTLALYNYHVTGRVMPWVMWTLQTDSPGFHVTRMMYDLPRFWTDPGGGLLAHAPVYLLAAPGLVLMWRRRRNVLLTLGLIAVPVALLSAAHSFSGGWTTPGRLVAAVLPLLALPLCDALMRYGRSPWFLSFAVLLALLSVSNGLQYNLNFVPSHTDMHNPTVSGWATPLLFTPAARAGIPGIQVVWWLLTLALLLLPVVHRRQIIGGAATPAKRTLTMATALLCFATAGSTVGAWSGRTFERKNQGHDSRIDALDAHLSRRGGIVWSGSRGRTTAGAVLPVGSGVSLVTGPLTATAGVPFDLNLELRSASDELAWGVATVRFSDGQTTERVPVVAAATVRHTFAQPGTYRAIVEMEVGESRHLERSVSVEVAGEGRQR
jgi:hypothetical protein